MRSAIQFQQNEIDAAGNFYRQKLARAWKLDFNSRLSVASVRLLTRLAYLDKRPLRRNGLRAEERYVGADHKVRVRIIRPQTQARAVLLDIHGGGWTLGNAALNDALNAAHAAAGFAVVSVEYRLAPKHRFTDLIQDCVAALTWVLAEGEAAFGAAPVVITGDSAGAHLSLAAAIACRGRADFPRVNGMALFYGCYDLSATVSVRNAPEDTLVMRGPTLAPFFERITGGLGEAERRNPALSPLYADLHGLPPCLLIVGTTDPLIDDSRLLSAALDRAGIRNELLEVPGAPHSFNRFATPVADRVNRYATAWMKGCVS